MFPLHSLRVTISFFQNLDKARLGKLVHKKTATAVALVDVRKEDAAEVENLVTN